MAEDKSDEWFAKHNRQKAAAWIVQPHTSSLNEMM